MSTSGSQPPDPPEEEDADLGEPLHILREGELGVDDELMTHVRQSIQRRMLAADLVQQMLLIPALVLLEFLAMLFSFAGGTDPRKEDD